MADSAQAVAARFCEFVHAVENKAASRGFQTTVGPSPMLSPSPILDAYEDCLKVLTDIERSQLDQLIQKMSGVVGR